MKIITAIHDMQQTALALKREGKRIAFVPTMGFLHEGHLSLVRRCREENDLTVVSIFVNPAQFGPAEDLQGYPRDPEKDMAILEKEKADLLFMPDNGEMYPQPYCTYVSVEGLESRLCGQARPGHFRGVATVVAKLLLIVQPHVALFGCKDFQQLAVIRRMVADLGLPVAIVGVPTVRDTDGLALSSRNAYLTVDQRRHALALPRALDEARKSIESGDHILVSTLLAVARAKLADAGYTKVDYLALVDAETLEPLDHARGEMRLIAAATIGKTRLIDNIRVGMDTVSR